MKKNIFSTLCKSVIFGLIFTAQGVTAQTTNSCGYTYPPSGAAVATSADFTAYQNSVDPLAPTVGGFGTSYTTIGNAVGNAGAGLSTNDKALEVTVDGMGSLQVRWNSKYQFYNNSASASQALVNGENATNTGLIVRFGTKTYYPEYNTEVSDWTAANVGKLQPFGKPVVTGTGTISDPYIIIQKYFTDANANLTYQAASEVLILDKITLINNQNFFRHDREVTPPTTTTLVTTTRPIILYDWRDTTFGGNTDAGLGVYSTNTTSPLTNVLSGTATPSNVSMVGVKADPTATTYTSALAGLTLGMIEISPWTSWSVEKYSTPISTMSSGGTLSNQILDSDTDIGYAVRYQSITSTTDKAYFSVYEFVTKFCPGPVATNDALNVTSGTTSSTSVLANDLNSTGATATVGTTSGTMQLTQVSTTNSGVTLDASGNVVVAAGTAPGTYTVTYRICEQTLLNQCATATATITVAAPPCPLTTAPTLSATSISNSCPATSVNLTSLVTSTLPSNSTLKFSTQSSSPTTFISNPTTYTTAGTVYAYYQDNTTSTCISPASSAITVTINICASNGTTTAVAGTSVSDNLTTKIAPTGGTSPYTYALDTTCTGTGTALSGVTISGSTATYTTPSTPGNYYYCVKVCDSSTPTAVCTVKTVQVTVTAPCAAGTVAPVVN